MGIICLIICLIIFLLGGVAIAFGVSALDALFILVGFVLFILIAGGIVSLIKNDNVRTAIMLIAIILIIALCLFTFVKCTKNTFTNDDGPVKCAKCGGDGKVTDHLGRNTTCPRCGGAGLIP